MYYVLDCEPLEDDEGGTLEVDDEIDLEEVEDWSSGFRLDADLPRPIEIEATPIRDYQGPPSDMYNEGMCLMSKPMVKTLRNAGVDNLEIYPVLLRNTQTDQIWDYFAVNIVGLVAAADLTRSKWTCDSDPPKGDVHFSKIVIDQDAACGLLMFRLSYDPQTILVHESVSIQLEKAGLRGLLYEKPEDWQT